MVTDASVEVLIANQPPSWQIDFRQADFDFAGRRVAALGDSMTVEVSGSYVTALRDLLPASTAQVDTFANATWKAEHLVEAGKHKCGTLAMTPSSSSLV